MAITVNEHWEPVGKFPDGSPILACWVMDGKAVVGRIVDLKQAGFSAEWVNIEGDLESAEFSDYFSAVIFVAGMVENKKRKLH